MVKMYKWLFMVKKLVEAYMVIIIYSSLCCFMVINGYKWLLCLKLVFLWLSMVINGYYG